MLGIGPGLTEFGDLNGFKYDLPMALAFALSWVAVFLCLTKGVKSSGKVVYFTALVFGFVFKTMLYSVLSYVCIYPPLSFTRLMARFTPWESSMDNVNQGPTFPSPPSILETVTPLILL